MTPKDILASIDEEIDRLQKVKAILTSDEPVKASKKGGKRQLSPEARQRIAEAQKRRWAAAKRKKA